MAIDMHEVDTFAERPFLFHSILFLQASAHPTRADNTVRVKRPRKRKVSFQQVFLH